jgi:hypothetical protein
MIPFVIGFGKLTTVAMTPNINGDNKRDMFSVTLTF